jgi:hypothetical protein
MKGKILIFMLILLLGLYSSPMGSKSDVQSSQRIEEAKVCFENYIKALKSRDEEKAKEYWNKEERKRYKMYDWQLRDMIFRKIDLHRLDYKIKKAEERDEHVILQVDWYYPEDSLSVQKDIRYFIWEDGKMVGANPIFVFTKDWSKKESQHFIYHFKTDKDKPDQKLLEKMDSFYEKIVSFLGVDYRDRIDYFRCDSAEEVGLFFNMEGSLAQCDIINGVAAGIRDFVLHEVVHIISLRILPAEEQKLPERYLDEGLAYYLGGATFFSSDFLLSWAKTKIQKDPKISLDSLVLKPEKYQGNEGAALMSSLVKFLIENYGLDKFKKLYSLGKTYDRKKETLESIYGEKMDVLETKWKNFVLSL